VLPLPHRCLDVFNRIQKIKVGRDGIEPPTPGFSALDFNRPHRSPSQQVAKSKVHGRRGAMVAANSVALRGVDDNLGDSQTRVCGPLWHRLLRRSAFRVWRITS
jgi:hypothetical protein